MELVGSPVVSQAFLERVPVGVWASFLRSLNIWILVWQENTQTMATLMFLNLMLIFYYLEIQFDRDRPRVREKVTREMEIEKGEMLERLTGRSKQR